MVRRSLEHDSGYGGGSGTGSGAVTACAGDMDAGTVRFMVDGAVLLVGEGSSDSRGGGGGEVGLESGAGPETEATIRERRANEAARIIVASCRTGAKLAKRKLRTRQRRELGETGHGQPKGVPHKSQEKINDSVNNRDPYPAFYYNLWRREVPDDLEIHRHGERWADEEGEGPKKVQEESTDERADVEKKRTLRQRAKRRIESLSWPNYESGTGKRWWTVRGGGKAGKQTKRRGSLGVLFSSKPPAADSAPDTSVLDISMPDISVPDTSVPDTSVPDTSAPDISVPDISVPDNAVPDISMPGISVAEDSVAKRGPSVELWDMPNDQVSSTFVLLDSSPKTEEPPTVAEATPTVQVQVLELDLGRSVETDVMDRLAEDDEYGIFEPEAQPSLVLDAESWYGNQGGASTRDKGKGKAVPQVKDKQPDANIEDTVRYQDQDIEGNGKDKGKGKAVEDIQTRLDELASPDQLADMYHSLDEDSGEERPTLVLVSGAWPDMTGDTTLSDKVGDKKTAVDYAFPDTPPAEGLQPPPVSTAALEMESMRKDRLVDTLQDRLVSGLSNPRVVDLRGVNRGRGGKRWRIPRSNPDPDLFPNPVPAPASSPILDPVPDPVPDPSPDPSPAPDLGPAVECPAPCNSRTSDYVASQSSSSSSEGRTGSPQGPTDESEGVGGRESRRARLVAFGRRVLSRSGTASSA